LNPTDFSNHKSTLYTCLDLYLVFHSFLKIFNYHYFIDKPINLIAFTIYQSHLIFLELLSTKSINAAILSVSIILTISI